MIKIEAENSAFLWASVFMHSLSSAGVRHIVISPGSRSTPLTLAAATVPGIKTHVIIDERSAAFFALGIGKAANQPAALICTSGTAVANYFPAVVEARMSNTPLLICTADRPPHLRNTGANQSIDQLNIFGNYPVLFREIGEPVIEQNELHQLAKTAVDTVSHAKSRQGPAHLNFPFSKPLEPDTAFVDSVKDIVKPLLTEGPARKKQDVLEKFRFDDAALTQLQSAQKPLIIIGQLAASSNLEAIFELGKQLHVPILSEQGKLNTVHAIQGFEGFLRNKQTRSQLKPDLILRFGRQPASKSVLQAVKHWDTTNHIYLADSDQHVDIAHQTSCFMNWNGNHFKIDVLKSKNSHWLKRWKQKEQRYFEESRVAIDACAALTDGHVYHHIVPKIPEDWLVFISNSFPARDQSMFGCWKHQQVFTNRGASGIDGITSTAMGTTEAKKIPGILFTGDLAFFHDTNALLNARALSQPLVVIIINNNGGSIFRMLPIAKHSQYFSTYFETPQDVHINMLAEAYGINYRSVKNVDQLSSLNIEKFGHPGLHIVECKTDPDVSMEMRENLWGLQ